MNSVGIREAKARLSALARAAAGKPTLLTDYGKPLAIIAPIAEDAAKSEKAKAAIFFFILRLRKSTEFIFG